MPYPILLNLVNKKMNHAIEKIIQRLGGATEKSFITDTYSYLERSKRESGEIETEVINKERETEWLIKYCDDHNYWFDNNQFSNF